METQEVSLDNLKAPEWHSNYLLAPDRRQLEQSLKDFGWVQNLTAQKDGTLIDGVYRARLADELGWATAPVVFVDADNIDAMILHLRMNRNRGMVVAKKVSNLIRQILMSDKYEIDVLPVMLGMEVDEFEVLADGTLIKHRNIPAHRFNRAWVPFESATGEDVHIERPSGLEEQIT